MNSRVVARGAATALLLVTVTGILYLCLLRFIQAPSIDVIGRPPVEALPERRSGRPMQALYELQAQAARLGWTSERLRLAGDLWREAGDLTRAVAYWEAAQPDASVLRDRAQAYIQLERWADAADALDQLLAVLPDDSRDRSWAQFNLGLIRAAYDQGGALDLLRAASSRYGASVTHLLPLLETAADSTQVGMALAKSGLWAYAELAFSQSADPLASAYAGLARDMQGKDGGAQVETALSQAPDDAQVRYIQGLHLRLNHDDSGSLQAMIQAVALDPQNPALYAELGKGYQLLGDLPTAERWLKFAVALNSDFQPLLDSFYNDEKSALLTLGLVDEASLPFIAASTPERQPTVQP
jgi:tetratricopeptide (TPR) repeat protein